MPNPKIGLAADRPNATNRRGQTYVARDTHEAWISDGTEWIDISGLAGGGGGGRTLVDSHRETTPGYPSWSNGTSGGGGYGAALDGVGPGWDVTGENDGTHLALVTVHIPKFYTTNIPGGVAISSVEFGVNDGTNVHTMGTWIQEKAPSPEGGNYAQLGGSAIVEAWNGSRTFEFVTWGTDIDCNAAISSDYPSELSVPYLTLEFLD